MLRSILFLFLLSVLTYSCTDKNEDLITEIELPNDPIEVDIANTSYFYSVTNNDTTEIDGGEVRRAIYDGLGSIFILSSGTVECSIDDDGILSATSDFGSSALPQFQFDFIRAVNQENEVENYLTNLNYKGELNGQEVEVVLFPQLYDCGAYQYPEVTITSLQDDFIIGKITGDLFVFNPDAVFPDPDDCDAWLSLGINTIDFSLPYSYCE